ncbi:hypothetical protein EDB83DRAFT_2657856 [Lactarius deliciosus]|nr:hypothetical protein EDB83DRAFT_2657856 [Lactarius deliciosus]
MTSLSPTDSPMPARPPGQSEVDVIYDLLADLPTVDDNGDPLSPGKFRQALVGALSEICPALDNRSPIAVMSLTLSIPPRAPPTAFTMEIKALQDSLDLRFAALEGAITGIQHPPLPSAPVPAPPTTTPVSQPRAQKPRAQPPTPAPAKAHPVPAPPPTAPVSRPTPKPSFASMAKTPARPSLVMSLQPPAPGATKPLAVRRSPQEVVGHLNAVLLSEGHLVTLSAARWTAKNNLVVTAGPDTTALLISDPRALSGSYGHADNGLL